MHLIQARFHALSQTGRRWAPGPAGLVKWFMACVAAAYSLWLTPVRAQPNLVSSVTLNAWDLADPAPVAQKLAKAGFNHVTLYVPWAEVEPHEGSFQYEKFDRWIAPLAKQGIRFILVLDFGGRPYFDDQGHRTSHSVIPAWFMSKHTGAMMRNFSGEVTKQINFTNQEARLLTSRFVDRSVRHFSGVHGNAVTGFAIGLQEEHEIKYGQEGYQWRDYGNEFTRMFKEKFDTAVPVINYNNEIAQAHRRFEPLLSDFLKLRDADLIRAVCHYAAIVRSHRQLAVSYFGEIFTSHDAIYGGGVVENLGSCVDIAVVDFNFYDGYRLKPDSDILPLMANYLAHNGFKKIMIGAYGERWANSGKGSSLLPHVRQSIQKALQNRQVIGYEIGGFYEIGPLDQVQSVNFDELARLDIERPLRQTGRPKVRIGLLASRTNFDFWHGERSNDRNIHQDALVGAYALLSDMQNVDVVVFGERALAQDAELVNSLDAVFVPHQVVLADSTKKRLSDFWSSGGVLIQDMRLGEFAADGSETNDWMHDVFGIRDLQWSVKPRRFDYRGQRVELDMQGKTYANHALLRARAGYVVLAKASESGISGWLGRFMGAVTGRGRLQAADSADGLVLRGDRSLVFGCLPQLVEGASAPVWRRIFSDEVTAVLASGRKAGRARAGSPSDKSAQDSAQALPVH
ncbi:MAG: beta-galactosidase [Comamonas sp.]